MPRTPLLHFALSCALLASPSLLIAQDSGAAVPRGVAADTGTGKILGLADIGRWNRIADAALSDDGTWMTWVQKANDDGDTLYVRQLDGGKTDTIPGGTAPTFSDDSHYVGYLIVPDTTGHHAHGADSAAAKKMKPRFELLDLVTGSRYTVPEAVAFTFSRGSKFLAVHVKPANGTGKHDSVDKHKGADLLLRELASGVTRNIGNVNLYAFDDAGRMLAYTIDAADRLGNGVSVLDLATGQSKVLNSAALDYDQLSWGTRNNSLAVLRGDRQKKNLLRDNVLLVWRDVAVASPHTIEYDPSTDAAFPHHYVVSEFAPLKWTRDNSRIYLGIKEQEPDTTRPADAPPRANVDVWSWKDTEVQSVQIVRLSRERRATLAAVFNLPSGKLVQLADTTMRNVTPTPDPRWAIGRIDTTYRYIVQWISAKGDYYRVNTETGDRSLIADGLTRTMGTSPDGKWFLYLKNGEIVAYNMDTGRSTTLGGRSAISFVDSTDDHPYEKPTYGVAGWSRDGRSVIMNHRFDLYRLPLDGGEPVNLTRGVGDAQQITFRLVRLDSAVNARNEDEGVDLSKPLLLSAFGEWTKKSGYYALAPGGKPAPLLYGDELIGDVVKARNVDRVIFTRQTFSEPPDYWRSNTAFASPRKVTDVDPFVGEYAWGSKVLVDFENSKGEHLQGTLTLPANYQPGKRYPMLVYFYERFSDTHHQFPMPIFDDRPHFAEYASDGYLVFEPDIVYQTGRPGSSALDCVTSGVKKVIELGYADPAHIGIQGHSWGGYESSYILTHTNMFAAVVTGAPVTNLVSFYDETYPGTGTLQQGIVEVGQVRMGTNPFDSLQVFEDQSALYHVRNITTPFLILQGTADNAVDWHQGLELYAAARRWGKKVIFLSYPGEPHHLRKRENQKDFQQRMKQFFDHYLKGKPAPKWMTEGVPQTRKGEPIQ